jgi:hypothetical protein
MAEKPENNDRSDYFTWQAGDLVPAGTPAPNLKERREQLLAKLPPHIREKMERLFEEE